MTPSNKIQAQFPAGALVIPNPEGTAPGIEFKTTHTDTPATIFALPGVPAEMKQMFAATVEKKLMGITGEVNVIHHHVIRCFGSGESHIESLLPDLVKRGRDPLVGITASGGTISLRLTTRAESVERCLEKMSNTQSTIESLLGDLVFGYNDDLLESVVAGQLSDAKAMLTIHDAGLHGDVASMLLTAGGNVTSAALGGAGGELANQEQVISKAQSILEGSEAGRVLVIGDVERSDEAVRNGKSQFSVALAVEGTDPVAESFSFSGHSATRQVIACKRVLNFVRLEQRG